MPLLLSSSETLCLVYFAGCTVHAYDHTISPRMVAKNDPKANFFVHKKGIDTTEHEEFIALENELERNGHNNSEIAYLKVELNCKWYTDFS